jgi:murein DD-endopeptidase MepM/ murein hydrolase activator NlpD
MMFDLLPSLLAQQSVAKPVVKPPMKAPATEQTIPTVTLVPEPIAAVAPPETLQPSLEAVPIVVPTPESFAVSDPLVTPSPLAVASPSPEGMPAPFPSPMAISAPEVMPMLPPRTSDRQGDRAGLREGGFSSQPIVPGPALRGLGETSGLGRAPGAGQVLGQVLGQAPGQTQGQTSLAPAQGNSSEPMISLPIALPAQPPQSTFQPVVEAGTRTQRALSAEVRYKERRQVIERKLAELVARDRAAKAAAQGLSPGANQDSGQDLSPGSGQNSAQGNGQPMAQASPKVVNAVQSARKGRFDKARQLANQAEVAPAVQVQLLTQISALEAEQGRHKVAQAREKNQVARTAAPVPPSRLAPAYNPTAFSANPVGASLANPLTNPGGNRNVVWYRYQPAFGAMPNGVAYANPGTSAPTGRHTGGMVYPLVLPEPITSNYGWRVHPITGVQKFHTGTDIGADEGTPIVAVANGRVTTADSLGGYGLTVVLEHNNGTYDTLYAHMSEIFVRPGQWVTQGSLIGRVGSTGFSTGPHLHFELRQQGANGWSNLDPGSYLEAARGALMQQNLARTAPNKNPISRR